MILKFYKQSLPLAPVSLVFWILLFGCFGYLFSQNNLAPNYPILPIIYEAIKIIASVKWLCIAFVSGLIYFEGRLINSLAFEKELLGSKNKLPHLFFILLLFGTLNYANIVAIAAANLFLILSIREILNLQYPGTAPSSIYKSGFYLGWSAIIFPLYLCYLPFVIFSLVVLKYNRTKEWLVTIFGFITPFIYLSFVSNFIYGNNHFLAQFWEPFNFEVDHISLVSFVKTGHLFLFLFLLFLLTSSILATIKIYKLEISRHKHAKQSILVLAGGTFTIIPLAGNLPLNALAAPIFAILFSFFFSWVKKWWIGEILLYLWLLIIGLYYIPYFYS